MNNQFLRKVFYGVFVLTLFLGVRYWLFAPDHAFDEAMCMGPPLRGDLARRNEAMENGYLINPLYDCIDKADYVRVQAQQAAWEKQHALKLAAEAEVVASKARQELADTQHSLAQARQGFTTQIVQYAANPRPLPEPPAHLFVRSDYLGGQQRSLPAYITPDPKDGQRHPAIIWLTGGDSNTLGDFWTPGPADHDESASAYREAGLIMFYPTLRGGNTDSAGKEFFFGEVEDVLAAADHLARQPYVDPEHIYLGGHSTGGTLALLTAESSSRFKAVFAFGAMARVDPYLSSQLPTPLHRYPERELKLRSPIHWLHGISSPTYLVEGSEQPANNLDLAELCQRNQNPQLHCIAAQGLNHFSVLDKVSRVIAARLAVSSAGIPFTLTAEEFQHPAAESQ